MALKLLLGFSSLWIVRKKPQFCASETMAGPERRQVQHVLAEEARRIGLERLEALAAAALAERVDSQFEQRVALKLLRRGRESEQALRPSQARNTSLPDQGSGGRSRGVASFARRTETSSELGSHHSMRSWMRTIPPLTILQFRPERLSSGLNTFLATKFSR